MPPDTRRSKVVVPKPVGAVSYAFPEYSYASDPETVDAIIVAALLGKQARSAVTLAVRPRMDLIRPQPPPTGRGPHG